MIYYANGVASARCKDLVSLPQLEQMINAVDYNSCLAIFQSSPLFAGADTSDVDLLLQQKKQELFDFIRDNSPSSEITNFFLLAQDFDNLGAICRLIKAGRSLNSTSLVRGKTPINDLILLCQQTPNDKISKPLRQALFSLPQDLTLLQIDQYFKQKKYETLKLLTKNHIMKTILNDQLDLQNISILLRSKSKDEFSKSMVATGNLEEKTLLKIYSRDKSILYNLPPNTKKIASLAFEKPREKSFEKINKLANELPLLSLSQFSKDTDTFAPFLNYCFLYLLQLKNIKMILSLKRNDVNCNLRDKLLGVRYD